MIRKKERNIYIVIFYIFIEEILYYATQMVSSCGRTDGRVKEGQKLQSIISTREQVIYTFDVVLRWVACVACVEEDDVGIFRSPHPTKKKDICDSLLCVYLS